MPLYSILIQNWPYNQSLSKQTFFGVIVNTETYKFSISGDKADTLQHILDAINMMQTVEIQTVQSPQR